MIEKPESKSSLSLKARSIKASTKREIRDEFGIIFGKRDRPCPWCGSPVENRHIWNGRPSYSGLGVSMQFLFEVAMFNIQAPQTIIPCPQIEVFGLRAQGISSWQVFRFDFISVFLKKPIAVLSKSLAGRQEQPLMLGTLRQKALNQFYAERQSSSDQFRIIVGGKGFSTLRERIGERVDRIFANWAGPIQKGKTGHHHQRREPGWFATAST
jgi:hypothetical protein